MIFKKSRGTKKQGSCESISTEDVQRNVRLSTSAASSEGGRYDELLLRGLGALRAKIISRPPTTSADKHTTPCS